MPPNSQIRPPTSAAGGVLELRRSVRDLTPLDVCRHRRRVPTGEVEELGLPGRADVPGLGRPAERVQHVVDHGERHAVPRARQRRQLRPRAAVDVIALDFVGRLGRALASDRDDAAAREGRRDGADGLGHGVELGPPVALRVVALERGGVVAGRQLAPAYRVQVATVGRRAEMLARSGDLRRVGPALAVEDLRLRRRARPPAWPPTTTILSPTTAAAAAARG